MLALTADAAIGNIQEKAVRLFHGPTLEVVYYTHLIGGVYIFIGLTLSGELFRAFLYCVDVRHTFLPSRTCTSFNASSFVYSFIFAFVLSGRIRNFTCTPYCSA